MSSVINEIKTVVITVTKIESCKKFILSDIYG